MLAGGCCETNPIAAMHGSACWFEKTDPECRTGVAARGTQLPAFTGRFAGLKKRTQNVGKGCCETNPIPLVRASSPLVDTHGSVPEKTAQNVGRGCCETNPIADIHGSVPEKTNPECCADLGPWWRPLYPAGQLFDFQRSVRSRRDSALLSTRNEV
jgi:hypothetical protein